MIHEHVNLGISIGNFLIPYYGLMIVLGLFAAFWVAYFQVKKYNLSMDDFTLIAATSGLFAIIGSKLLFFVVSWKYIDFKRLTELKYLNEIMAGGFVFYGGLIGTYLRYCTPVIPTLHFFGRIGCYLVGCCYGEPFKSHFSVTYTHSLFAPNNIQLFPTQLAEAAVLLLIAVFLLIYINKFKGKHAFELYIVLYGIIRFILEFFRYDSYRGIISGFSTSQYISIFLILSVLFFLLYKKKQIKKTF